jgi:ketosteroid isomerase-like protein
MSEVTETARAYYEAIDADDYDRFADLLASGVVHERPGRTIEGRDALVGFTRDDRPQKDTSHEVAAVYVEERGGTDGGGGTDGSGGTEVAVRGRLRDADGNPMFEFVDAFELESATEDETRKIVRIRTYTR